VHPFEDGAKLAILNGKLKLPKEGVHQIFFDLNRMFSVSLRRIIGVLGDLGEIFVCLVLLLFFVAVAVLLVFLFVPRVVL
jgi:hypothetical protein